MKNLGCVANTWNNDETNPKTDIIEPHIWWNTFFVQMEAGLMKKVQSVNRSWTPDIFQRGKFGENVHGKCPDTATRGRRFPVLSPGSEYPRYTPLVLVSGPAFCCPPNRWHMVYLNSAMSLNTCLMFSTNSLLSNGFHIRSLLWCGAAYLALLLSIDVSSVMLLLELWARDHSAHPNMVIF